MPDTITAIIVAWFTFGFALSFVTAAIEIFWEDGDPHPVSVIWQTPLWPLYLYQIGHWAVNRRA